MLNLFDYPIMLSNEEIDNVLNGTADKEMLADAHRIIYDVLIYPTFNQDIKDRIIVKYSDVLSKSIKRAIFAQYNYLVTNGGDVSTWSGLLRDGQTIQNIESQEILTKIICHQAVNILRGAPIDILYAGG